jgi:hypothetical protein
VEESGLWDTYDTPTAAEIDRFKAAKRSPEFDWRVNMSPAPRVERIMSFGTMPKLSRARKNPLPLNNQ